MSFFKDNYRFFLHNVWNEYPCTGNFWIRIDLKNDNEGHEFCQQCKSRFRQIRRCPWSRRARYLHNVYYNAIPCIDSILYAIIFRISCMTAYLEKKYHQERLIRWFHRVFRFLRSISFLRNHTSWRSFLLNQLRHQSMADLNQAYN